MAIKDFELFHGAVLTRLVRSDRPLTLRLIETHKDSWAICRLNDEVSLLLKHSTVSTTRKREEGSTVWQFSFSPDQLRQLSQPSVWVGLVCGASALTKTEMDICLLDPTQVQGLLDAEHQSVLVKRLPGKSLRATSGKAPDWLVVPRDRLDKWAVPGS